jgi:hypothetical protein
MNDERQIRQRMQLLVARVTRRDAYGTLLASGQVIKRSAKRVLTGSRYVQG